MVGGCVGVANGKQGVVHPHKIKMQVPWFITLHDDKN